MKSCNLTHVAEKQLKLFDRLAENLKDGGLGSIEERTRCQTAKVLLNFQPIPPPKTNTLAEATPTTHVF
jgi:hypothetical protein